MEKFLTTEEAAKYLGLGRATLERYRSQGIGPAYCKVGPRFIRYSKSNLDEWVTETIRK